MIAEKLMEKTIEIGSQCTLTEYTNPDMIFGMENSKWYRVDLRLDDFGLDTVYFHYQNLNNARGLFNLLEKAIVGYE